MIPFTVVIPARHDSTRLPGKPLLDIGGKPMVIRVADRARASGAAEVVIATDHSGIMQAALAHGHSAAMTRNDHASGTDRVAEVAAQRGYPPAHIVVNVQGDEPLIEPELIRGVAQQLTDHPDAAIATACCPLIDAGHFVNPNIVKVVVDKNQYALYFSRAPIPHARDAFAQLNASSRDALRMGVATIPAGMPVFRHIGIYAYRSDFLASFARLAPPPLEQFEALEQLRALWHGYRISVGVVAAEPHAGVDTADDLARVRALLASRA